MLLFTALILFELWIYTTATKPPSFWVFWIYGVHVRVTHLSVRVIPNKTELGQVTRPGRLSCSRYVAPASAQTVRLGKPGLEQYASGFYLE